MNDIIYDYPKSSCHLKNNSKKEFKKSIQPTKRCGYSYLNPQVYRNNVPADFNKNIDNTYSSLDPRLIDVPRGFTTSLDRPPIDGRVHLDQLYTDNQLEDYGKKYKSYTDVNSGQILYYTDRKFDDVYFHPNFVTPAKVSGVTSFDPMGGLTVNYERFPVNQTKNSNLSWINDSTNFREDLMSLQTRQIRQYDWNPLHNFK